MIFSQIFWVLQGYSALRPPHIFYHGWAFCPPKMSQKSSKFWGSSRRENKMIFVKKSLAISLKLCLLFNSTIFCQFDEIFCWLGKFSRFDIVGQNLVHQVEFSEVSCWAEAPHSAPVTTPLKRVPWLKAVKYLLSSYPIYTPYTEH